MYDQDDTKSKKKKKQLEIAEGLLDEAKSYEGKLLAVQMITEREKDRVVLMFKKMLAPAPPKKTVESAPPTKPKPPEKKKSFLGRK